jgi:hypothetical protein
VWKHQGQLTDLSVTPRIIGARLGFSVICFTRIGHIAHIVHITVRRWWRSSFTRLSFIHGLIKRHVTTARRRGYFGDRI